MYGSLIAAHAVTLLGPATLMGGYSPETKAGLLMVLLMSLAAAATLGVLLGRWIYRPSAGETGEGG